MKKWLKSIGLVTSVSTLAAGVIMNSSAVASAESHNVVQLTYWNMWSGIWEKLIQQLVAEFNQTHPNIHVNVLSIPGNNAEDKLLTAIAAGDPPDVFTEWNPYVAAFAQKHALVNLSTMMTGKYAGLKKGWFYPVAAQWGTYQNRMYAMPWMMNSFMLYYNKDMLKSAGQNPNKPPTTITQFDNAAAKEYVNQNGAVRQVGYYANQFDMWMPAFGLSASDLFKNGKYNMLNPKAIKLMDWISSYKKYPYSQVNAFFNAVGSANGGTDPFVVGKQGFFISGMWEMSSIQQFNPKLTYGVAPLPYANGGYQNTTWVNGGYNEIPVGSKHVKQAFEFITWLSGYDNIQWAASAFPKGGWIPDSPKITAQPAYQKWLKQLPLRRKFVNIMLNRHDAVTPVTPIDEFYEQQLGNAVNFVLQGKKSPVNALSDLQKQLTHEMAKNQ